MHDMNPNLPTPQIWDDVGQLFIYGILLLLVIAVVYMLKILVFPKKTKDNE